MRLSILFLVFANALSAAALSQDEAKPQPTEDVALEESDQASTPGPSQEANPEVNLEPSEEQQQAFDAAIAEFEVARQQLADAIADQREVYIRYVNRLDRTPAAKLRYSQQRGRVRQLMDEAYRRALDVTRTGVLNEDIARFIVTMVQHRVKTDYYDEDTFEGAAKMLDAGNNLQFMFAGAARSALTSGVFESAGRLFDHLVQSEHVEEIDKILYANLDSYKEQWDAEQIIQSQEAGQDRLPRVKLETTQGDVVVELFLDQAPTTVSNFIRLVEQGFYDGLDFYQVIDHALALTGDPSNVGEGNSGKYIVDEHVREDSRYAFRGSLVMAKIPLGKKGDFIPNSASSQFAILYLPVASLTEKQTVFGRVIEGMDVVSRFQRVDPNKEKKKGEIVVPADTIIEASVIRRPDTLPEPEYVQSNSAAR